MSLPSEERTRWYKSDDDNYGGEWMYRAFVVIPTDEVTQDMISAAIQTSVATTRKSLDESKTLLKFRCTNDASSDPSVFDGYTKYSHPDIMTILAGDEWTNNE
jgi:hypothetical protein